MTCRAPGASWPSPLTAVPHITTLPYWFPERGSKIWVVSGRQKTEAIMARYGDPDPYDPIARTGFRPDEPQHWNAIWGWIAAVAALVIVAALMFMTSTETNVATNTTEQPTIGAPSRPAPPPTPAPTNPSNAR
jgi:hypothetical protein